MYGKAKAAQGGRGSGGGNQLEKWRWQRGNTNNMQKRTAQVSESRRCLNHWTPVGIVVQHINDRSHVCCDLRMLHVTQRIDSHAVVAHLEVERMF